ncbi:uncharacterized protein [Zea mays]|uniref:uncharacterized protein n=1 Tax=Zea mays TaxID=4577 RepID=UPI001651BA6F|nr:uncharacterized protein LOC103642977 [Zea mays]
MGVCGPRSGSAIAFSQKFTQPATPGSSVRVAALTLANNSQPAACSPARASISLSREPYLSSLPWKLSLPLESGTKRCVWKPPPRSRLAHVHLPRREPTKQFSHPLAPSSARTACVPASARALVWLGSLPARRRGQPASPRRRGLWPCSVSKSLSCSAVPRHRRGRTAVARPSTSRRASTPPRSSQHHHHLTVASSHPLCTETPTAARQHQSSDCDPFPSFEESSVKLQRPSDQALRVLQS